MTTATQAYEAICAKLKDAIDTGAEAICGYVPLIQWPQVDEVARPDMQRAWLAIRLMQSGEIKRSLSKPARITRAGIVEVMIYAPADRKESASVGRNLAALVESTYAGGEVAGVSYSKAFIRDMPGGEAWKTWRVSATYDYTDFQ